ncbi:hypothetical protein METBIDRAFT_78125 [Metschnikowia bicuspidata var. bicuspidata NRRL YB-4993]|uniref:C2H2-type domain-containing protein n=1 Tax=Metschnikowia bicuspidata var. bicuspidata NRRL YB-4993 TaxID=869754 RepID=A0A1A0HAK1_9ASCO|nr:hypothetical protein METBIDRAFT_78125 [Metschnikowia bicuspidata var. bicuspidata NRRL YB-4993]OBA21030.1 hypothetical protein METBIDRAFT_78125 [Metschnikowia bicuspidata var. bicuspidata NRRL YB-4993]
MPLSGGARSQGSAPTSAAGSQDPKTAAGETSAASSRRASVLPASLHAQYLAALPLPPAAPAADTRGFSGLWFTRTSPYHERKTIRLLLKGEPQTTRDYAEHLYKVACLLYDGELTYDQTNKMERKLVLLTSRLPQHMPSADPAALQLHLVVERCFDVFIKMSMNLRRMEVATHSIRFLTSVVMALNYWQVYSLLRWRPALYQFLTLIGFDLNECYARFLRDYHSYAHEQQELDGAALGKAAAEASRKRRRASQVLTPEHSDNDSVCLDAPELADRTGASPLRDKAPAKKRARPDLKQSHRVVARSDFKMAPSRSSNYDPDVVHECQLPAPEDASKMCLRRFSRKYELIRHQETVHSKKKKLFKCYVCVKQDPAIGPRIFTRHDTLAKHIRVNHRISGKEAKAEVAYSKKHAEIVEEGDITVHVGRRKTKVDFELRAHMDKRGAAREGPDGVLMYDDIDELAPDSIHSGDEGLY